MLEYEAKTDKVEARLDAMSERLKEFGAVDMPHELTAWQTDDMHRKYPETHVEQQGPEETRASTAIYPRSRPYADAHPRRDYRASRQPSLSSMPRLLRASMMRHPILRP